jgi:hypothetical protein
MKDTFDLTKFLKENKSLENLNPTFKSLNESLSPKDKIREMILAELGNSDDKVNEYQYDDEIPAYNNSPGHYTPDMEMEKYRQSMADKGIETDSAGNKLKEAKKDEEVEDVETTDTTEDVPAEDAPAEEAPATGGGLEDIAADMEGTEGDLMDHLMKALKVAKGMNNEKLETQIGNTLKFFVSEYIGGEEQ